MLSLLAAALLGQVAGAGLHGSGRHAAPVAQQPLSDSDAAALQKTAQAAAGRKARRVWAQKGADGRTDVLLCNPEGTCSAWVQLDAKGKPLAIGEGRGKRALASSGSHGSIEYPVRLKAAFGPTHSVAVVGFQSGSSACEGESCGSSTTLGAWLVWGEGDILRTLRVVLLRSEA